ncbi:MAG: hypothetical protein GQ557_02525, partial [Mycoplasmataceae bacterium]|nr:hypothetical protein [Mycoplasmataceae bacterium]
LLTSDWIDFFNSGYYVSETGRYGIFNLPLVIIAGFFSASGVLLYIFCIGAFVEVMLQSGTLEAGTASLVKKMKGKEILLIPILFVLFCFGGTAFGMQEETLGLIPLIIPFLVIAGFDTMTGLLIVVVGTTSGIAASVLDPFSIGVMASSLSTPDFEVTVSTGIIIRIIMFIVFATLGSIGCMWYGHRSRKGKDYVLEPEKYEENKEWAKQHLGDIHETHDKMTKRQVIGLSLFAGTFAVMVFSLLPWTTWFPVLVADPNGFWTVFSSLFFDGAVFGEWYFLQLSMMFIIMTYISAWTFQMSVKETNSAVSSGIKGMFGVAMILVLSRSVAIILTYSGITIAMVNLMFQNVVGGEEFSEIALAWILFPIFALLAVFIPSTSGLAGITGPLIAPIINSMAGGQEELFMKYAIVVMVVYPLAQGTINMFSPTTGLVVAQAEASKVSYGKAMPILALCALITMITGMLIISTSTMFI